MSQPIWITREVALAMHLRQLAEHGGGAGVRDEGLLLSALQGPMNKYSYENADLLEMAAAYAFGIARNHPFVDGNKRTALVASFTFLLLNGVPVTASQASSLKTFLSLASGDLTEAQLTDWFSANTRLRES
jgi:death on curing protein